MFEEPQPSFHIDDPFRVTDGKIPEGHTSAVRLAEYAHQLLAVASAAGYGAEKKCIEFSIGGNRRFCHNNAGG